MYTCIVYGFGPRYQLIQTPAASVSPRGSAAAYEAVGPIASSVAHSGLPPPDEFSSLNLVTL